MKWGESGRNVIAIHGVGCSTFSIGRWEKITWTVMVYWYRQDADWLAPKNADQPEIHGGLAMCHWTESEEMEEILKGLKVTARCIPLDAEPEEGKCIFTGQPSQGRAVFAKAY